MFSGAFAKRLDLFFDVSSTLFLLGDLWGVAGALVSVPKNAFRERLRPRLRHRAEQ